MRKLSHRSRGAPTGGAPAATTVGELIARGARRLSRARLTYGHGTDNARDEAAALVFHALGLPHSGGARLYGRGVAAARAERALGLIERRIEERVPAAYLMGHTWFAGVKMRIDPRVLIPRSPIAELIERRFSPWIDAGRVHRVLDLGTGSGCIAIACAKAFPRAAVDAADVSPDALAVARINARAHRLGRRVRTVCSDHFDGLGRRRYDIIVSNPPYVGARELASLPAEYRHEPRLALAAGRDGLDSVRIILSEAGAHLTPGGILVVEVGDTERAVRRAYPRLPFTWLHFERGGGGVFLLRAEVLMTYGQHATAPLKERRRSSRGASRR